MEEKRHFAAVIISHTRNQYQSAYLPHRCIDDLLGSFKNAHYKTPLPNDIIKKSYMYIYLTLLDPYAAGLCKLLSIHTAK